MNYTKSYIEEIIKFYVENPKYLIIPLILSLIFTVGLRYYYPNWAIESYIIIGVTSFPGFALIVANIIGYWKETKLEEEYNKILENLLEIHFIIPPISKFKINYHKQDNKPHRIDEISIPFSSKTNIFLWIKPKIDIDIRERQFGFGDKPTDPKILKYDNPYIRSSNVPLTWYIDWWDNYHIYDKISRTKSDVIVHGFEIETHDKGEFVLDIRFNISCNKFKNFEKTKTTVTKNELKVNVI